MLLAYFWWSDKEMNGVANLVVETLQAAARASPFVTIAAVAVAAIRSWLAVRSAATDLPSTAGIWIVCCVHLVLAAIVFGHLATGGWLEEKYRWNDANIVNLSLGVFELVVVMGLAAFWSTKNAFFYLVLRDLAVVQGAMAICAVAWVVAIFADWPPRNF